MIFGFEVAKMRQSDRNVQDFVKFIETLGEMGRIIDIASGQRNTTTTVNECNHLPTLIESMDWE